MSTGTLGLSDQLADYVLEVSLREPEVCRRLRERTLELEQSNMLSSPEQAQLLVLLGNMIGARRIVEIGTFTGYTALRLALGLCDEARIVCCDVNEQWPAIGREYWREAGVDERIELRLGDAKLTLDELLAQHSPGTFDLAYIDADKENYLVYFERCLDLLRTGGLIAVDNVLWGGSVVDPGRDDADTRAIRAFNQSVHGDLRVELSLVPIGDGLSLLRKL